MYSQTLGPFRKWYNRLAGKMLLPRISVVVARGRVDPYGRDVENPSDNVQEWPAWAFLCDECTKLVFPSVNYHEDIHFVIPLKNAETRVRVIPQLSLTL